MAKIRGYKPLLTTFIMIVMLLAVLVLPAIPVLAQGVPHSVFGTITCSGTPDVGASVTVITSQGSWGFTSGAGGNYGGSITISGASDNIQVSASHGTCSGSTSASPTESATQINLNMLPPPTTTPPTPTPVPTTAPPATTAPPTPPPATTNPPPSAAQTTTPPPTTTAVTTPPPTTSPPTTAPPTTFPPTPTPTTTATPAAPADFDMFMILGLALMLIIAVLCGVVVGYLLARRAYERVWRNTEGLVRFMRENQMTDETRKGKGGIAPGSSANPNTNPSESGGKRIRRLK